MVWIVAALALLLVAGWVWLTQPLFVAARRVEDATVPDAERLEHRVRDLVGRFFPRDFTHPENLALADRLAGATLARRVELVAYALEEMPFFSTSRMGSAVHARSLKAAGRRVRGMLCLEMIGCFSKEAGSQQFPLPMLRFFYPGRGNFIAVVGNLGGAGIVRRVKRSMRRASDLPVHSINAPALVPGVDLSDHLNFWRQGDPAVMITDTAFFRNPRYHTEGDVPATLDYRRMGKVVAGVRQAVLDLAQ